MDGDPSRNQDRIDPVTEQANGPKISPRRVSAGGLLSIDSLDNARYRWQHANRAPSNLQPELLADPRRLLVGLGEDLRQLLRRARERDRAGLVAHRAVVRRLHDRADLAVE